MSEVVHVITNAGYFDDLHSYPKAFERLLAIEDVVKRQRLHIRHVLLRFQPDYHTNALDALVAQVERELARVPPRARIVTCMGDGGTGTYLRAAQILQAKYPNRREDRFCVLPGGTMNLIAKALGVDMENLEHFLQGDERSQAVVVRELVVKLMNGERLSFPWAAFAGVGLDARILQPYDRMSRANHVLANVGSAALELAPQVLLSDDHCWDMAFAVAQLGLMRFNPDRYDRLAARDFHRIQLGPESGVKAAAKALALQVAGIHPSISDLYWEQLGASPHLDLLDYVPGHRRWRGFMEKIKPKKSSGDHRPHPIHGSFTFHCDGFPHELPAGMVDEYHFASIDAPPVPVYAARAC